MTRPIKDDDLLVTLTVGALRQLIRDELAAAPVNVPARAVLLDRNKIAEFLDVSLGTLDRLVRDEGLPFTPVGNAKRFEPDRVMAWAKTRTDGDLRHLRVIKQGGGR